MKLSSVTSARTAETDGKWFEYEPGVRFALRPLENPEHKRWLIERSRKLSRSERKNASVLLRIDGEGIAYCVVCNWEGITNDDGTAIPYSAEKMAKLLNAGSVAANDIRAFIVDAASNPAHWGEEAEIDADRKEEVAEASATFR